MNESIEITGLMVRTLGQYICVEVEIDGKWHVVIREFIGNTETSISHIIEPRGIRAAIERGYPVS